QRARGGGQRVAGRRFVQRQVVEGRDAARGGARLRAGERRAARVVPERDGHGGAARGDEVVVRVEDADGDRRAQGLTRGGRGGRLDAEPELRGGARGVGDRGRRGEPGAVELARHRDALRHGRRGQRGGV